MTGLEKEELAHVRNADFGTGEEGGAGVGAAAFITIHPLSWTLLLASLKD